MPAIPFLLGVILGWFALRPPAKANPPVHLPEPIRRRLSGPFRECERN